MAGSQVSNVELMSALTGLTHDIFVGKVRNNVRRESPTAMLFQDADAGDYHLEGQNMVFAVDLRFKTGGMATTGYIPDFQGLDAVPGKVTPTRRLARIAVDNLVEQRASGPGSFQNLDDRIFEWLWESWKYMEIRHSIGFSTALVAKISSRSTSTVVVLKDGYGHVGTNPIMHIAEGSVLTWWDVSATGIGGAAKVSSINYSTNAVTMDSATTWEPDSGVIVAANDLVYFATTNNKATAHFEAERNSAPNGMGTIVDFDAANTTVFNISETTYPRWKPYRVSSTTFDHLELTEHWLQLGTKRGFPVAPDEDTVITFPSAVAQLARGLMGFQQQAYSGGDLKGGYGKITVSGIPIVEDGNFYHDVAATVCRERLYRVPLGGDADFWSGDGSMWSRIADYDGKDAYVVEYLNYFCNHRGANGALTGISTDVTDTQWEPVPNY